MTSTSSGCRPPSCKRRCTRSRRTSGRRWRSPPRAHPGVPRAPGPRRRTGARPRRRVAPEVVRPGRPGRSVRARRSGRLPVDRADDRDPRAARRGPRDRALRAADRPTAGSRTSRWPPPRWSGSPRSYRVGGAQAIAALAYGTESMPAGRRDRRARATCTSSVAKREVAGAGVGIESPAGPSELVVVADEHAPATFVAADLARAGRARPRRRGRARDLGRGGGRRHRARRSTASWPTRPGATRWPRRSPRGTGRCWSTTRRRRWTSVNVIAPEHLELVTDDPEALLPLVRNAGAVFLGPWRPPRSATTSPGRTTCCPPAARARFASALRVDDFRKHIHVVRASDGGPRRARPARRRSSPPPRASTRTPARSTSGARSRSPGRPRERAGRAARRPARARGLPLAPARRLGAAEHEREPVPAAARVRRRVARRAAARSRCTGTRTVEPGRCARRSGAHLGQPVDRVFCANGSNEVLQTLLLTYGGPGRRALVFEPTYALHAHIARITGTEVVVGERGDDFAIDPGRRAALIEQHQPEIVFLCSPNNPTGTVEPAATVEAVLDARPVWWSSTRPTASSRASARSSSSTTSGRSSSCARTRRCGRWPRCGSGSASRPPWVVAELEKVVLPYHLDVGTQLAGTTALQFRSRDGRARAAPGRGARARRRGARRELDGITVFPSGANFLLFRSRAVTGHARLGGAGRAGGARAGLLALARASRTACGSRSARPTRTTRSCRLARRSGGCCLMKMQRRRGRPDAAAESTRHEDAAEAWPEPGRRSDRPT